MNPAIPIPSTTRRLQPAARPVRVSDVDKLCSPIGRGYRLQSPGTNQASTLMRGSFSFTRLREGLSLHCTDIVHLRDMSSEFVIPDESIKILLRLEGNAEVVVGKHVLSLAAGEGANAVPSGAVVAMHASDLFQRHSRAGTRQRMVVLSLKPAWFEAAGMPYKQIHEQLSLRNWTPTSRAIALAEQLIHPVDAEGAMHQLHLESRSLELIIEALSQTLHLQTPASLTLPASVSQRVRRLQALLDSGEADNLDMRALARHIGCNANTLREQFRNVCGQTIFDYLRQQRLQRAAHALQHEGVSVARAAEIAGYSSQANFSTAFRRQFGLMPKHCRNRL